MALKKNFGPLQKAMIDAGMASPPKERKRKTRSYPCHKCGGKMTPVEGTNVMACSCGNYFIFTK